MFAVERQLEQHEATLWRHVGRLFELWDVRVASQVGHINQLQQQAAPTPVPALAAAPQLAVPVPAAPAGQRRRLPRLAPGLTYQRRWGCDVCWQQGDHTTWDRKGKVDEHGDRVHYRQVGYVEAPRRERRIFRAQ